jgi:2-methylcitrate dehydratase PrpD
MESKRVDDLCIKLAGWIASVKVDDQALFAKARVLLTDAVTLAVAARGSASASALGALIAHDAGPVTAWGSGRRSGPMSAVLANALLAHERFQDDCEMRSWTHPGSFVVPAAIAGAEMAETSFGKALEAIAVGYAVTAWLGAEEAVALSLMKRGFRCSPTLAPFAAAAAFARGLVCETHSIAAAISAAA